MTHMNIKRKNLLRRGIAGAAVFGAMAIPGIALATQSSAAPIDNYCTQYGCQHTAYGTPADPGGGAPGAGAGAFGFYAHGGVTTTDPTGICTRCSPIPQERAANGPQTGLNNSALAGNNPRNGLTQETPRTNPANNG